MTAWLSSTDRARLSEKLSEFAQTIAGTAELSGVMAAGAQILQELWGADQVSLWVLSDGGAILRWCAGTTDEWRGTELELARYPRLAELFRSSRPHWVELGNAHWPQTPTPLLGGHSFVFLPLTWLGEAQGCAVVIFAQRRSAPEEEELGESQVVAALLTAVWRFAQERQRVEACLKGILDSIQDGVWLIGADRSIQLANNRLAHLFGVDPGEIAAGQAHDSIVERLKAGFRDGERVAARWLYLNTRMEEVFWEELELMQPRHRILERFVRPLYDPGQRLIGRLEIYRDVTAQRQLEHKVIQRERLATLGQLVSGVAHELNNPLTAVGGYAQILQRHKLPEPARQELTRIAQEAERASRIVKNLLLFARPTKPVRQCVSVREVLERALEFRTYELTVENIAVERHYAAHLPAVWAEPSQLQQVFLNILLNAEQAIRSVRDCGRIVLRTTSLSNPERVRVEISDDGPGIPPEELPHVLEPFYTTKVANEGTGLGLSVSRAIVKEHGGEIYVESRPAGGATFAVELPVGPIAEPVAVVEPKPGSPASLPGPPRQILVVDDERSVAQLIADVLRQQGYGVELRINSRQALQDVLERKFDLVICDIKMPEINGEAFHRLLVERSHPLATRILFTTGDTLARSTHEFLERVGLPCLAKPFLVDELKAAVGNLLVEQSTRGLARFL
ncbi:MAG: ATP-binding protein [Terriglobia bacterium]